MKKFGNSEFSTNSTNFYDLDAIVFVEYRANSHKATMFRIRATNILKECLIKGLAMNDKRLKTHKCQPTKNPTLKTLYFYILFKADYAIYLLSSYLTKVYYLNFNKTQS